MLLAIKPTEHGVHTELGDDLHQIRVRVKARVGAKTSVRVRIGARSEVRKSSGLVAVRKS